MLIFIRHGEKSKHDDINLSRQGYVRRNTLPSFFIQQKNKHLNVPERIFCMKQHKIDSSNRPFQTVTMIGHQLSKQVEAIYTQTEIKEMVSVLENVIQTDSQDVLVCWEHEELAIMVQTLIKKLYPKNTVGKLHWGRVPISTHDSDEDYTSIWVVDPIKHYLYVYNEFDVIHDSKEDIYSVDYSQVQIKPLFSIYLNQVSFLEGIYNKVSNVIGSVGGVLGSIGSLYKKS
jgi:hypothetical protein